MREITLLESKYQVSTMKSNRGKTSQTIFVIITIILLLSMILSMVVFLFQG